MKLLLTTLSLALVVSPCASAATIFIETFDNDQFLQTGPGGGNPLTSAGGLLTGSNSFGGARAMQLTRTSGISLDFANVSGGLLDLNFAAADSGYLLIIWDGDTDGTLNQNGVAPADLTDGGINTGIGLSMRSDLAAPIVLTFYSGAGNFSTYTVNSPALGFAVPFTDFQIEMTNFVLGGGTGADFTAITAVTMLLDGQLVPGVDIQLDDFRAEAIPEPATFGMVLLGLGGLMARHRKGKA